MLIESNNDGNGVPAHWLHVLMGGITSPKRLHDVAARVAADSKRAGAEYQGWSPARVGRGGQATFDADAGPDQASQ